MPIMLEKLYDALRAADIPDGQARAAAVEVADFKEAIAEQQEIPMPIMLEKLYDALRAAGVPDEKARAAAVEVAEFKEAIAEIRGRLRLHTWILSAASAGILAIIGLMLRGH